MSRSWHHRMVLLLLLALMPGWILAQGPPPDLNRNDALIRRYDADGDGKLSDVEIQSARPPGTSDVPRARGPVSRRPSGRGAVENAAWKNDAAMQALLDAFDVDGDGKLDLEEMAALRQASHARPDAVPAAEAGPS